MERVYSIKRKIKEFYELNTRMKKLIKNKKGWIKIVEAFIAILLITSVALIIISKSDVTNSGVSKKIYNLEKSILKEIQLNDSLRSDVLRISLSQGINNTIDQKIPSYLKCEARICSTIQEECQVESSPMRNLYVQSTIISANLTQYTPKQLKIFCWVI
ncbi:MAG: hypothetical protein KKF48_03470 [Nanoarchaeota archaeon]|nr:hypothetical protein [Nanoarchaeota archaeon]MBU1028079.1 hypothetical protein [Nanoarchaeota archaeon]